MDDIIVPLISELIWFDRSLRTALFCRSLSFASSDMESVQICLIKVLLLMAEDTAVMGIS